MNPKLPCCLFAAWMVMLCQNAMAQQNDTTILREIDRIDIYAPARRLQASPTQEIGQEDLQRLGIKSVADALRMFNGVSIKDYGGIGGLTTVSVRSLGAAHTAVAYDGVPVSNTQAGPVDVSMFDVSNISNMTLAVGTDDQLLKPARLMAHAAVLSVDGNDGILADSLSRLSKVILKYGSFGYWGVNIAHVSQINKRLSITANAQAMGANGEYPYTFVNYKNTIHQRRHNTDVSTIKGEVGLNRTDSIGNLLKVKMYAYNSERGLPGSVVFYNDEANERLCERNFFVQASYRRRLRGNLTAKVLAKYNYSYSRYDDTDVKYQGGHLQQNSTQNEGYISFMTLWQPYRQIALSASVDESYNTLDTDITDNPQPRRNTILAAANMRYYAGNVLTATLSAVATHVRETVSHGSCLNDLDKVCPSLTIKITPFKRDFNVRLMTRKTFRVPTFNELYYTTLGYSGLVPEKAAEYNVGVGTTIWHTLFSVDVFRNIVRDKIVAKPTTYVWKMTNYGKAHITGAEVSLSRIFTIGVANTTVSAGYTYQQARNKSNDIPRLYNSQIPYTPLHSGHYSIMTDYKDWSIGYHAIWSGKRYFWDHNIPANEMEGYIEHTVSVSKKICKYLDIKASCINIGNTQYEIIKYYPMPGIQYQLQLCLTL